MIIQNFVVLFWKLAPDLCNIYVKLEEKKHDNMNLGDFCFKETRHSEAAFYTRFQCYVHRRHLRSSFDMLFKRLFNCERAIFHGISGRNDK